MILGFIGIGNVGFAIADSLQKKGHHIIIAHDNIGSESVLKAQSKNKNFEALPIQEAIDKADVLFLATPFFENESILKPIDFRSKTLVDCTNPVGKGISHGLASEMSGAEKVQEWAPTANVVKAFTIYGFENLIDSNFSNYDTKPVMLIAGNSETAKKEVTSLTNDLGFYVKDTGSLDQALHLEHMTLLWVKMVRRDGHHPNFVWGYLER